MTLWIGTYGSLVQVPSPARGMDTTPERPSTAAATIGGGRVVSFAPALRRTFKPAWATLTYDQYAILEAFHLRHRGPGPFIVLDSARRNHLTANQAAATSVDNDPTGFTVDASEALASNPDSWLRGPRSLRWSLPGTVIAGILELDPPAGLPAVPAPAGQPWTWSGSLSLDGLAPTVNVTPALSWRRIDGSEVSVLLGTPTAVVPGAWTQFSVTAAGGPPAGAVGLRGQLRITPGVLASGMVAAAPLAAANPVPYRPGTIHTVNARTGGRFVTLAQTQQPRAGRALLGRAPVTTVDVLLDQPLLDMAATVRAWAPGSGVPQCSWLSLTDVETWVTHRMPVQAVLVEVG